jgi:competence protein ComGC
MNKNKGFTLIELLAIIVILVIILAIAIPGITHIIKSSTREAFRSDAKMVLNAAKYKGLEDEHFDPLTITEANIKEKLGLSRENYYQVVFSMSGEDLKVTIIGQNKWKGFMAYGTLKNMAVVETVDSDAPIITISGDNPAYVAVGGTYTDAGATATDIVDGSVSITSTIITNSSDQVVMSIDTSIESTYTITYTAKDKEGNTSTIKRTVRIVKPDFSLSDLPSTIDVGDSYKLPSTSNYEQFGGEVICKVDDFIHTNTSTIPVGNKHIICTGTINGNTKTLEADITINIKPITGDSIISAVKNNNFPDGDYDLIANGVTYPVELINIRNDITYKSDTPTISLGNTTADQRMLIVKYYGDVTIDSGVTLTASTRKKGMFIYATGSLTNNGTITMTARGATAAGQDVYLWKNTDGSYEYVPAVGASGGASVSLTNAADRAIRGQDGLPGSNRKTGGGGSGGVYNNVEGTAKSGVGGAGTSYSGGAGGGASTYRGTSTGTGGTGSSTGGAGGNAYSSTTTSSTYPAGGGAGNPGGLGKTDSGLNAAYNGFAGTGGLLIIYSNDLLNQGTISSNGSIGGSGSSAGGSSGGGSINIFATSSYATTGTISAAGGTAQTNGSNGGNGSVTAGYIYNNNFTYAINFSIKSGSTYKSSYSVKVNAIAPKLGIKTGSTKYVWTTSATAPAEDTIVNDFVNGDNITTPLNVSGSYYLWVAARDNANNLKIDGVGPFNVDSIPPVISINGSDPVTLFVGDVYSDAGATATDNKDGTLSVSSVSTVNPSIVGTYTVSYTATDSVGNVTTTTRTVRVISPISGDSILTAIKGTNYSDGDYRMIVNGTTYDVELINIDGNKTYTIDTPTVSLGNATADQRMLIVKYNGNLTIDSGVTLTASTRKKGMFIYVAGTLTNNGTISMTARGATAAGQNVYLWKNADGSYEYVPAVGASGGASVSLTNAASVFKGGLAGTAGTNRGTGGGGSGGAFNNVSGTSISGIGGAGTSYSGGAGGGATTYRGSGTYTGYAGSSTGGAGGAGLSNKYSASCGYSAGGGAGNPGGAPSYPSGYTAYAGGIGTGGLLIIYSNYISNTGTISSDGVGGGYGCGGVGGSSGGGSINIFHATGYQNTGIVSSLGGVYGSGGAGGNGSVTVTQINW